MADSRARHELSFRRSAVTLRRVVSGSTLHDATNKASIHGGKRVLKQSVPQVQDFRAQRQSCRLRGRAWLVKGCFSSTRARFDLHREPDATPSRLGRTDVRGWRLRPSEPPAHAGWSRGIPGGGSSKCTGSRPVVTFDDHWASPDCRLRLGGISGMIGRSLADARAHGGLVTWCASPWSGPADPA
jgi:hypothetical protein